MRVLIYGDIYGRIGRKAFTKEFNILKDTHKPDFIVANIENITSGRGPISEHAEYIRNLGVDVMTSGDHIYDNAPNIFSYLDSTDCRLIRPANLCDSEKYPLKGKGYIIVSNGDKKLVVIQLMGEVFMSHKVENPFIKINEILSEISLKDYDGIILDFHRETTAELYGMGNFLDGRLGVVYGTHTHIQTNDAHILPQGTGIIADVGMNGPFNSVIGADFTSVERRFVSGIQRGKIQQQLKGPYIINAICIDIDPKTKLCSYIENISFTGNL